MTPLEELNHSGSKILKKIFTDEYTDESSVGIYNITDESFVGQYIFLTSDLDHHVCLGRLKVLKHFYGRIKLVSV